MIALGGVGALVLLGGGFFAWNTFMATPPPPPAPARKAAPAPASAPAATPSDTLNKMANVPGNAVKKANEAIAARAASEQAEVSAALGEAPEQPAVPTMATAPAVVSTPTTGVTQLSAGLSATTALDAVADPSQAFRSFIANAKLSGVVPGRGGRSAAALINGRLTRAGDVVDTRLGITFEGYDSEKKQLIFKDKTGATVARRY